MTSLRNKRILVTGGAGFIGSNLVKTLVQKYGASVTVLDDLFTGDRANLAGVEHQFIHGTVEDEDLVSDCVQGKDIVFHLAARNIIISNLQPREDFAVNVVGSFNVFEACKTHGVKRVVYSSSSSIFGNADQLPVKENDLKTFLSFYAASKFSAEVYAKTFYELYGLPVCILRYSNVYGINQTLSNPYCGVIGKFITAALKGEPLHIFGTGLQTRDFTYIDDAVEATIAAAIHPEAIGQEYNIGTGQETSIVNLAQLILRYTESNSIIDFVAKRDIDNIDRRCIDIQKASSDLHYFPNTCIKEGLKATIKWFNSSPVALVPVA